MNYGKNQQALLKFLQKHPNRWHKIKRRKAIDAARRLSTRGMGIRAYVSGICIGYVQYDAPQMLREQA